MGENVGPTHNPILFEKIRINKSTITDENSPGNLQGCSLIKILSV
jgi:hypothetical protein